jgi:hypothetical protein
MYRKHLILEQSKWRKYTLKTQGFLARNLWGFWNMPRAKMPEAFSGLDGRSRLARRVKALRLGFSEMLGHPDDAPTIARIRRAAELTVVAEQMRQLAIAGDAEAALGLSQIEGTVDRAVRSLGVDKPREKPVVTLSEYLRERAS